MSKKDELIKKYATELKEKCGITPDMGLLQQVTTWCGPSIYNRDASTVSEIVLLKLRQSKIAF